MVPRRPAGGSFDPTRMMDRIDERADALWDRVDGKLAELVGEVQGVKSDVRMGNMKNENLANRIGDVEMQLNDMREDLQRSKGDMARGAAQGAAEGATKGMAAEHLTEVMKASRAKWSRPQWIMVGGMCFVIATNTVEKGPALVRAVSAFFSGLAHLDGHK